MQNHWLNSAKVKQLFKEIDELAMDTWGVDGTLGDFFSMLNDEQSDLLFSMKIKSFDSDLNSMTCNFDLDSK